ncbi:MAG: LysE family translocator [Alphaproteobacteria bacterium]|nr:LysE family transporter [Pseudomonadota bacterium]MCH7635938.1 LysE family transporter [Pseudomonadota bacterium]MCZ6483923.1 LysE family transporter [Alphaproteobacteria bacterium]TDI60487.1 MAG: LysE family translocator [Alphaproteobacteria bacterium]
MDTTFFFLKGIAVGFVIAAPVGPVGMMCIHRTIADGKKFGFVTGLGAAIADTLYGCIAAFGLGFLAAELINYQMPLRGFGGVVLCVIGIRALSNRRTPNPAAPKRDQLFRIFVSTFFITVTNPLTILSFVAIFAAIGIAEVREQMGWGIALVAGVFIGSAAWWALLTSIAGIFHKRLDDITAIWVGRFSGVVILGFGLVLLASLIGVDMAG